MVLPIYNKLKDNKNYEQLIFALTTSQAKLKSEHISYISYRDFLYLDPRAKKYGEELIQMQTNSPLIEPEESVAYLGFGFLDLVIKHGEEKAYEMYKKDGRFCFFPTEIMKLILSEIKPDVVIATNSPRSERASLVSAKNIGITALCMADLFDRKDMQSLADFNLGTKVCVINEYAKSILTEMGRAADDIVVTGNPAFDRIYSSDFKPKAEAYKKLHIKNNKSILWARSTLAEDLPLSKKIEEALLLLAMKRPDYTVIVRPHPNDSDRSLPHQAPNIIMSEKSDDIYTLLYAVDIIYTLYSTVGLEAAFMGKQVLQQINTQGFETFNLVELGYAHPIADLNNLESTIAHVLSTSLPKNVNTGRQVTNAADNIISLIQQLLH